MTVLRVTYVGDANSRFCAEDVEILQQDYIVTPIYLDLKQKNYLTMLWIGLTKILPSIIMSDVSVTWTADYHAFYVVLLSRIFFTKSIILVGGHEVCNMPEAGWGYQQFTFRGWVARWVLRNATGVVVPSKSYQQKVLELVGVPAHVIANCSEIDIPPFTKEQIVTMVAGQYVSDKDYIALKGIATYNAIGSNFKVPFVLIGEVSQTIRETFKHITYFGSMEHKDVITHLSRAKVYCQLSYTESFGVALLEALQCGCVPVVTNKDGMAELVGENGYHVPYGDVMCGVDAVGCALNETKDRSELITYYKTKYNKQTRGKGFKSVIQLLLRKP